MNPFENVSSRNMLRITYAALLLFFITRFAADRFQLLPENFADPVSGLFLGLAIGTMYVALRRKRTLGQ